MICSVAKDSPHLKELTIIWQEEEEASYEKIKAK